MTITGKWHGCHFKNFPHDTTSGAFCEIVVVVKLLQHIVIKLSYINPIRPQSFPKPHGSPLDTGSNLTGHYSHIGEYKVDIFV